MELYTQYLILFIALAIAIVFERMGKVIWAVAIFFGTGAVIAFAFNQLLKRYPTDILTIETTLYSSRRGYKFTNILQVAVKCY